MKALTCNYPPGMSSENHKIMVHKNMLLEF